VEPETPSRGAAKLGGEARRVYGEIPWLPPGRIKGSALSEALGENCRKGMGTVAHGLQQRLKGVPPGVGAGSLHRKVEAKDNRGSLGEESYQANRGAANGAVPRKGQRRKRCRPEEGALHGGGGIGEEERERFLTSRGKSRPQGSRKRDGRSRGSRRQGSEMVGGPVAPVGVDDKIRLDSPAL
jgi:hypothetical protein